MGKIVGQTGLSSLGEATCVRKLIRCYSPAYLPLCNSTPPL